jgi:ribosomal protein S14
MNFYLIKEKKSRKFFFDLEKYNFSLKVYVRLSKFKLIFCHNNSLLATLKSRTHFKNRCFITGRGKGVYKNFGISRIKFRQLGLNAFLVGVKKV